jgi:nitronate monooxygenase
LPGLATALGAGALPGYAIALPGEADRMSTGPGEPRWDDDRYNEKLGLLCAERVPAVSLTFGCPPVEDVQRLHGVGCAV